jgi:uncharacterized cupin superfamily protein
MNLLIKQLSEDEFRKMGIYEWPIWEKEVSVFDWNYDEMEQFYVIEGEVSIKIDGKRYLIHQGDFVECPKGLCSQWEIKKTVKKHYHFVDK